MGALHSRRRRHRTRTTRSLRISPMTLRNRHSGRINNTTRRRGYSPNSIRTHPSLVQRYRHITRSTFSRRLVTSRVATSRHRHGRPISRQHFPFRRNFTIRHRNRTARSRTNSRNRPLTLFRLTLLSRRHTMSRRQTSSRRHNNTMSATCDSLVANGISSP